MTTLRSGLYHTLLACAISIVAVGSIGLSNDAAHAQDINKVLQKFAQEPSISNVHDAVLRFALIDNDTMAGWTTTVTRVGGWTTTAARQRVKPKTEATQPRLAGMRAGSARMPDAARRRGTRRLFRRSDIDNITEGTGSDGCHAAPACALA